MTTIVYHRADDDGKMSRAVVEKHLNDRGEESNAIGWDYGDAEPVLPADGDVWVVDISIDSLFARAMEDPELRDRIIWIDHHKSAIERWDRNDLPRRFRGLRYDGIGACRLCWLFTGTDEADWTPDKMKSCEASRWPGEPWGVFLVGLRDVWRHKGTEHEVDAERLRLGLVVSPYHRDVINDERTVGELVDIGVAIERYERSIRAEHCERAACIVTAFGLRFLALNTPGRGSGLLEAVSAKDTSTHDALMVWCWTGKECVVSLYHAAHRTDLDLSRIATAMHGGGHRGACGFRCGLGEMVKLLGGGCCG